MADANASFFSVSTPIAHEARDTPGPLAYRWYDPDRRVLGKRMEEHLRIAVCYWHTLCWPGTDPFGGDTFLRPWMQTGDPMARAREKADVAFELFRLLGTPFFTFHDRDVAPEGSTATESLRNLAEMGDVLERKMAETGVRLLWGTANLFSNRRYMAGAATNPDPEVFAYAASQVKAALELTYRLGGANYVLWGGREGYETLLNTDLRREIDQLGRFLHLVVEHKHRIGFEGTILIEPKPKEPTKHQYDFDVASIYGLLLRFGLQNEVKINIEANHATLAGHSFEHEIALAGALGLLGSLDMNRGDLLLGWDTDQFPNDVAESARVMLEVLRAGGLGTGGLNFDAKIRRQSIDPDDLLHAHVGGIDVSARGLLIAERMIEDGALDAHLDERYAGWSGDLGRAILAGERSLLDLAQIVERDGIEPAPRSGQQERLENLLNTYL